MLHVRFVCFGASFVWALLAHTCVLFVLFVLCAQAALALCMLTNQAFSTCQLQPTQARFSKLHTPQRQIQRANINIKQRGWSRLIITPNLGLRWCCNCKVAGGDVGVLTVLDAALWPSDDGGFVGAVSYCFHRWRSYACST